MIHAPLCTIWKVQTDVGNWPSWQPDGTTVTKDTPGRLRPGSVFRRETQGLGITSTVNQVVPGKRLAWGVPRRASPPSTCGRSRPSRTACSSPPWSPGPVHRPTPRPPTLQAALDASLHAWVNNLKHESESHA
ncbi:SRPBCC family protein [Streptomyces sp. NPDC055134]